MRLDEFLAWLGEQRAAVQAAWQWVQYQVIAAADGRIGFRRLEGPSNDASDLIVRNPPVIVGPEDVVVIGTQEHVAVIPPPRAAWDDQGWTVRPHPCGQVFEGQYRVRTPRMREPQCFAGCIVQPVWPGSIAAYIADPPPALRQHPKGACFQLTQQPPWFRVHWHRPAGTVDDALLYMERVLEEALDRAQIST